MRRAHVGLQLGIIGGLFLAGIALAIVSVVAAAPSSPLVAQAGTAVPTDAASATAESGSPVSGASVTAGTIPSGSAVGSPVAGTAPVSSIPVPPALPPPVAASSGPSAAQITFTVIASLVGVAIVAVGGWGLIHVIGNTTGTTTHR
jgi:hypothetical protein